MPIDFSDVRLIRPAAIVPERAAMDIVRALENDSVHRGGLWLATPAVWERYDQPWTTFAGAYHAQLIGTINVVYDKPRRHEITIYRVNLTDVGTDNGWTVDTLCDEPLGYAGLTLESCPRDTLAAPPPPDPFKRRARAEAEALRLASELPRPRQAPDNLRRYLSVGD